LSARTTTLEKILLLFYHPSHAHRGSILSLFVAIFFPENNTAILLDNEDSFFIGHIKRVRLNFAQKSLIFHLLNMGKTISSSSTNDIRCSMKKTGLFPVPILALLIVTTFTVGVVNSAVPYTVPTGPLAPPTISIEYPTSTTYVRWFVPILFSVNGSWDGYVNRCSVELSLDGGSRYGVLSIPFRINWISRAFSTTLGPLSEGQHTLEIFATVSGTYRADSNSTILKTGSFTSKTSVNFKVNTEGQGQLTLLSPQNQTYNYNKDIPVAFNVNPNASITSMGYTLDQQSNVTIPRNTTIYGPLSDGPHTLKVYSVFSDILPVYSTINFTVDTTPPNVSRLIRSPCFLIRTNCCRSRGPTGATSRPISAS